ncbi:uncharacterized protein PHACADRAFT_177973 [Phanerochaete carnosa HHB-10118-sp]|uniref:Uncharacterized protein n=1 Tax=Phanerochaete carnosa (strain HHB-10118-sp) TaxID=650164 RepID=K5VJ48_PHACS|nr:uncharacterized protein PHACADRAFT_177973 [Phanerochaete carnosa HHB-10118-sp]EKM51323.1 hypothetical protein PHACADRAFT_177973 [Phanerochaete carnosa HHB-10118-sp]
MRRWYNHALLPLEMGTILTVLSIVRLIVPSLTFAMALEYPFRTWQIAHTLRY